MSWHEKPPFPGPITWTLSDLIGHKLVKFKAGISKAFVCLICLCLNVAKSRKWEREVKWPQTILRMAISLYIKAFEELIRMFTAALEFRKMFYLLTMCQEYFICTME